MQKLFLLLTVLVYSQQLFVGNWKELNPKQFESTKDYSQIKEEIYEFLEKEKLIENKSSTKLLIEQVSTKVIVGLNYKFLLIVNDQKTQKTFLFYALVWKKINETKQFEVTEYKIIDNFSKFQLNSKLQESKELKNYLQKFHQALHVEEITFHLKLYEFILQKSEKVIANYILEGTNNEISQFEHIISISPDKTAFSSLAFRKLKIGYFFGEDQIVIEEKLNKEQEVCSEIQSYYKCLLKNDCHAEIDGCNS